MWTREVLPTRPLAVLLLLSLAMVPIAGPAMGEDKYDVARRQYPDLFKVYYDANVLEYCGLITRESNGGFHLSRDALILRDTVSEDQQRNIRISAYTAADVEYENRGLGGYKGWCRTEGKDAYDRFVAFFVAHHIAEP